MKDWLMVLSLVAGLVAACLAIVATSIPIRDQIDAFMGDIHRQGTWGAWAAMVAAAGVILQALHYFFYR